MNPPAVPHGIKIDIPALERLAVRLEQIADGAMETAIWSGRWQGFVAGILVCLLIYWLRRK